MDKMHKQMHYFVRDLMFGRKEILGKCAIGQVLNHSLKFGLTFAGIYKAAKMIHDHLFMKL
jgi:hypothetical protein